MLQFIIEVFDIIEFGIFTTEFSNVRTRVLLKVISSTVPSYGGISIQSPTINGLSKNITNPPKRFFAVSWAASVTITPPTPSPATKPFKFTPNNVITINPAAIYIIALTIFKIKSNLESSTSLIVFSFIFFTNDDFGSKLAAKPLANATTLTILNIFVTISIASFVIANGTFKNTIDIYIPNIVKNTDNGL